METLCQTEGCTGRVELRDGFSHGMQYQRQHTHATCPVCGTVWTRFVDDGSIVRAPDGDQENVGDNE